MSIAESFIDGPSTFGSNLMLGAKSFSERCVLLRLLRRYVFVSPIHDIL